MPDDFTTLPLLPTRSGTPQGHAIERKMLGKTAGSDSISTVRLNHPDGSTTILKTRGGSPHYHTTEAIIGPTSEPPIPHTGGFILAPTDGGADGSGAYSWDDAYLCTAQYKEALAKEKPLFYTRNAVQQIEAINLHTKRSAKPVTWTGTITSDDAVKECVVTWDHGLGSRYRLHADQDCSGRVLGYEGGTPFFAQSGRPHLIVNSREVKTQWRVGDTIHDLNVVGAGVFDGRVVFVSHVDIDYLGSGDPVAKAAANSSTATVFYRSAGAWKVAGKHTVSSALKAPWFFSPNGSVASSVRETTPTNQWLMTINLSLQTIDDIEVVVSAFSQEAIADSEPFYVDTTTGPVISNTPGDIGWQEPSSWVPEEYGRIIYVIAGTPNTGGEYTIDWRTGSTIGGTRVVADEMNAYMVANNNGYRGSYGVDDYRVAAGQASYDLASADWTQSMFYTYEIWMMGSESGGPYGQTEFRAYRDTNHILSNDQNHYTFPRTASGKRTLAVDYAFTGELLAVTEELVGAGTHYSEQIDGKSAIELRHSGYFATTQYSVITDARRYDISGNVEWRLKINDVLLLSISGGVNDGGVCSSAATRTTEVVVDSADLAIIGTTTTDEISSYAPPSNGLHVERGWLIDMDARTKTCVYEKWRTEFSPLPLSGSLSVPDTIHYLNKRLECAAETAMSVHVLHQSAEIHAEEFPIPSLSSTYMLRPHSTMMELVPRLHDLSENVEEQYLLQVMDWNDNGTLLEAYRFFYMAKGLTIDAMPRRAGAGDVPGQVQARNTDQVAVSTSSITTTQLEGLYGAIAELHPVTYYAKAFIRGATIDIADAVVPALMSDGGAKDFKPPGADIRFFPARST